MPAIDQSTAESAEILTAWSSLVDALRQGLQTRCEQLGKQGSVTVYSSHAGGPLDQEQLKAVLAPLLSLIAQHGIERPLQRRAAKKAAAAQIAVTIDCVNDWFFVRVSDDGTQVRNDLIYAVASDLSTELSRLLAIGGNFTVEKSSARGMSYTFSWERRDTKLIATPEQDEQSSAESAA